LFNFDNAKYTQKETGFTFKYSEYTIGSSIRKAYHYL